MATTTLSATKANAKKVAVALRSHVDTLLLATAVAQVEREKCGAIQARVLWEGNYANTRGEGSYFIRDPEQAWLMSKHDFDAYWARVHGEYQRAGYTIAEYGQCPALIAENLQLKAEWALIAAAEPFLGVTNDQLLCGTKEMNGLDCRQKYLDLLIGLVVNFPGYVSPLKRA